MADIERLERLSGFEKETRLRSASNVLTAPKMIIEEIFYNVTLFNKGPEVPSTIKWDENQVFARSNTTVDGKTFQPDLSH